MAYRKKVQNWLEKDCEFWGIEPKLICSDSTSFVWHLDYKNTTYEVTYSDLGELALNALPSKIWPRSEIREIYVGTNSKSSYQTMINLLSDNFSNI